MIDFCVSILGDCVTNEVASFFPHKRACGLNSWLSVAAQQSEKKMFAVEDILEESVALSNYQKRSISLDVNKNQIEWLLGEKADYLIIDLNDMRFRVLTNKKDVQSIDDLVCFSYREILSRTGAWKSITDFLKLGDDYKLHEAADFDIQLHYQAIEKIITKILKVYDQDEIIINEHLFARYYTDNIKIIKYEKAIETFETEELLKKCYQKLYSLLPNSHVIHTLDNPLGNKFHRFGCFPLHYDDYYYEYVRKSISVIIEKRKDEKELLENLRLIYSNMMITKKNEIDHNYKTMLLEQRLSHIADNLSYGGTNHDSNNKVLFSRLRKTEDINAFIDMLFLVKKHSMIVLCVKDTPGYNLNTEIANRLRNLGFGNLKQELYMMYAGVIFNGACLLDQVSSVKEESIQKELDLGVFTVDVVSESFNNGNCSKIIINGTDYSLNCRGLNIVVFDTEQKQLIDSVSYDSHRQQAIFSR